MEDKFEVIRKALNRNRRIEDRALFNRYVRKNIDLEQCYEMFCYYYDIPWEDLEVEVFKEWLASIGWKR